MIQSFATPSRPFRRLSAGLGAVLVACAGLAALLLGAAESEQLWPSISICSGIAGLALILAVRSLGFDWASGPVVYLSYLWLFHFPLALFGVVLSNAILRNVPFHIYQWTLTEHWYKALLITVTCAAAFALGVSIFGGRKSYGLGTRPWTDAHSIA